MSGLSVSQVAARLNMNVEALKEWRRLDCPLFPATYNETCSGDEKSLLL
jgi:hypothetical protein